MADFTEAIRLAPQDEDSYAKRGEALLRLKRWRDALGDFSIAIDVAPKHWSFKRRSEAYLGLGQLDAALADVAKAIDLNASEPWVWYQLARVSEARKDYQRAAEARKRAFQVRTDDQRFWASYAQELVAGGRLEKYREFCEKLVEKLAQTDDLQVASRVSICLLYGPEALDDWLLPIALSDQVLASKEGREHGVKSQISEVLCRAGQYERSLELRREAIAQDERQPHGWDCFWQAMAYQGLGDIDRARDLKNKARELANSDRLGANNQNVFEMMYRELTEKLDPPEAPPSKEDVAEIATKE